MGRTLLFAIFSLSLIGCDNQGVEKDKSQNDVHAAPPIAYEPLLISENKVGPFSIIFHDTMTLLGYQARSGTINLMESVATYPDAIGYIAIEKAYSFGANKYVLIVSTGENGLSCPATTYVLSFDAKQEHVDGHSEIEGCSEIVESLSEGNKLTIKKDGKATLVYNGTIK